jgi:biopolymer transport protein ExbD
MPLKTSQDEAPWINLTPMIDIVFQLIIFFMVGTSFSEMEKKVNLSVPEVASSEKLNEAPPQRVINVYRDGRIELDKQIVSLPELQTQLAASRQLYDRQGVIVRGDAEGAFQNVANVLAACRDAGISDMGISVRMAKIERKER